ncbi:HEPN domain-containing protein [Butyricimonas sp. Marseille-P3923]|uniref:HEPN domain-containing protein n=1 Tax=Butyricimonas sp. Marseille-P3923 TaxID=1987504 RepID=UPI000C083A2B|nr:HEPN domain-containing protein [Butyricimonas sp. Marseille-P3923]
MKEQLSQENTEALVAYRLQRAKEALAEIPYLKTQGYYNTAVNRLYYACYYATVALLIKYGINPGTHAGVKQMLGMHFVATGRLPRELGRSFSVLFERRHSSDYDDFAYSDEEEINELLPKAIAFIKAIEDLLQE